MRLGAAYCRTHYKKFADDAYYTPEYQELYRRCKETIERVLADAKEKHTIRYAQVTTG